MKTHAHIYIHYKLVRNIHTILSPFINYLSAQHVFSQIIAPLVTPLQRFNRAVATGTAGTAMAVLVFDKIANKFEQILFLLLDLSRSMYRILIPTYNKSIYIPLPFIGFSLPFIGYHK